MWQMVFRLFSCGSATQIVGVRKHCLCILTDNHCVSLLFTAWVLQSDIFGVECVLSLLK